MDESLVQILKEIVGDFQQLFRAEFALAQSEVTERISRTSKAVMPILAGLVLALAGLPIALMALAVVLAVWLPIWGSLLLVTAAVLISSGAFIRVGLRRLSAMRAIPERAVANVKKDAEVIKEHD